MKNKFKKNLAFAVETKTYNGPTEALKGRPITGIWKDDQLVREVKTGYGINLKAPGEDVDVFDGVFSVMGNVDTVDDRIHNGAFTKTIKERGPEGTDRILHLWCHEMWDLPIAKVVQIREIGKNDLPAEIKEIAPDATGAVVVRRKYLSSVKAKDTVEAIREGALKEMSFAFDAINYSFTEVEGKYWPIRELHEVRLYETSDVPFGANPATLGDISKSISKPPENNDTKHHYFFQKRAEDGKSTDNVLLMRLTDTGDVETIDPSFLLKIITAVKDGKIHDLTDEQKTLLLDTVSAIKSEEAGKPAAEEAREDDATSDDFDLLGDSLSLIEMELTGYGTQTIGE